MKKQVNLAKVAAIVSIPLLAFILWYIFLPAINLHSFEFWIFLIINLVYTIIILITFDKKYYKFFIIPAILLGLLFVLKVFSATMFHSTRYANLINKESSSFEEDIKEASFEQVPTVDRDTAQRLGSRKMGEMLELVSQYNVSNAYTQINYDDKPVRVTPLEYNGFLKWLGNKNEGIPNYIIVDMIDGKVELKKLKNNIKFSKSDKFSRDIYRYLRLKYPLDMFFEINFEIDEEGIPYWIAPVYHNTIGWFGGLDVKEVILTNATNGETTKYAIEDVPKWVDRIYNADEIIRQLNWNGGLQSGFLNSLFAQKGVLQTTEGYNYLAIDDDVYLYTGMTSVGADESNVGFVLVNLRTKETKFYKMSSAEEFSAMESAEGAVQEKGYISTFPILLNIDNKPTYFMSLKDEAGLVKMYALVDAQNYQQVSIGTTVSNVVSTHIGKDITDLQSEEDKEPTEIFNTMGKIISIESVVIDGNTHYYFILDGSNKIFIANIGVSEKLPFIKVDDEVNIEYYEKNNLNQVTKLELK
ncbi:hypothetical protein [Clostridium sp. Cult2]|uniref:hypothetical protein n=1 Tax=Clostridium sp. Cult2 TaxID=2079003 RepID=UPI001F159876|nr:hypothetical protein [Clostridium sp. Cult2]MCF6465568.1 hypothetical protein [Clostridium sp. Cult2]